ncbi:MAG TPA: xanthine dehydrogenase family protein molybdopterin-binding subunit [Chloroflexi bacterium]|jgi:xanthine dehydrogenase molybdenum-binding subunit|nr:xanthine dehydrogenase family protein molybdopterin-binding subunit [Chloroflexota bacterium]
MTTKTPPETFAVIGTTPPRVDAGAKVTGAAVYGVDVMRPRMAYGRILRSPHAHARIVRIDTRRAEAMPGVLAVATAADLPAAVDDTANDRYARDATLASERVLYHGHPVCAIAATTPEIAEDALALIDVDYEPLEPVLDVCRAMERDAPILHPDLRTRSLAGMGTTPTNVAEHLRFEIGDPDKAMDAADVVVEREFRTATVHQGYMEPHAATAEWSPEGTLTIWATTQGGFSVRDRVHELLHLPMADIRVVPTEVGGAFGGKNVGYADIVAALLARKANRPVRVVMSREETLLATGPTSGTWMRVAVGARRDGRITAAKAELRFEAGAFPGAPVGSGANCMFAPYDIPNGRIDGYGVVVNKPSTGDYRSPGATQAVFAAEAVLDEVATLLGMDPIAFRLLNCAHDGTARITGGVHEHIGIEQVLEATRDSAHYRAPCPESTGHLRRGRGVALGFWGNWGARSSVTLTVAEDGTVSLLTGSVDITGTRTSLAMQAAETLGLPLEMIAPAMGDTHSTGYSDNSGGSRTTMATGIAVVRAAEDLLARMKERVAAWWGVDASTVTYALGAFTSTTTGDTMSWAEAASHQFETGGAVRGQGDVNVRKWGAAYATHIVDVEVDTETGGVRLLRHTVVQDVGRAIHPGQVASQMQGGTSQGIGWALYEGYAYDAQGRMLNANLLDYKMPTYRDVPTIETILVEVPYPGHPYGIRGVGEAPIVAVPAAIAAAIHDAVGVRPTRLPMDPVQILELLGIIDP